MPKMKFQNFSGIKNEQHSPRAIAQSELKNGYVVVRKFNAEGKETASVPTTVDETKGELWFVNNTITTPELLNYDDFVVKTGDFAKIFSLVAAAGEIIEMSGDLAVAVSVGDVLIADKANGGKWKKAGTSDTGYAVALKVVGLNTIGGKGYDCLVTSIPAGSTTVN